MIILGLFLLIGFLFYKEVYKNDSIDEVNPEKFINKIDSLELVIDSLSIKKEIIEKEIDTVYIEIHNNDLKYEENCSIILNNDVNEDYKFFSNYIEQYKSRFDSINSF